MRALETLRARWHDRRMLRELMPRDPLQSLTRAAWVAVALNAIGLVSFLYAVMRGF